MNNVMTEAAQGVSPICSASCVFFISLLLILGCIQKSASGPPLAQ